MKKTLTILFAIIPFLNAVGQNLVQNPSFENYTVCPTGFAGVSNAVGWSSFSETPDYFNSCGSSIVSTPSNIHGYHVPKTGNAYAGLITFDKAGFYREIMGSQLSSPLVIGQKYYVSFYVCLTIKPPNNAFAANKIGAKFTTIAYSDFPPNQISINNVAQFHYDTIITDTTNWTLISGSFIADSAYKYIAIGNFFDDLNTDTSRLDNGVLPIYAYYYIDDIFVSINQLGVTCQITVSSASVCQGNSATLTASGANTYTWSNGSTNNSIMVSPSSTASYTVTGIDTSNCISTAVSTIIVGNPPVTANSSVATVCAGGSVILTGSGASLYSWTGGVTDGLNFIPSSTKTYTVTGTDINNCSNYATINIKVNNLPVVTANSNVITICAGGSAILTGTGASSYSWTGGVMNGINFVPVSTKTYTVTGTDGNNCFNTDTTTITVIPLAIVTVGLIASATTICAGTSVTLTGTGASSYLWSNGSTNSVITVLNSGMYWVQDNLIQCSNKDSLFISEVNCESEIEVPNIYTPNNDGLNDVFKISTKNVSTINCKIYNRWGILVSELKAINEVWDGNTTAGLQCTTGVYFWIVEYENSQGANSVIKGFLQLAR